MNPEPTEPRGLTNAEIRQLEQNENDADPRPLDEDDLSEGDVVEVTFSNGGRARYEVGEAWTAEDAFEFEDYDSPADEAEGKFPGLQATRVWISDSSLYREVPRYRATLMLDADSRTGAVVDNWTRDEDGEQEDAGYVVHSLRNAEVVDVDDRLETEGTLASSRAKHVRNLVADALRENEIYSGKPESWTVVGADASGTDCFGHDRGVTVRCSSDLGLQAEEAWRAFMNENLNDGTWFEVERRGEWTFYYDDENGTHALR